ncbi:MAG: RidA family protein [Alphaproteobacteria bacterium]|nr:RidA family protein [Alphaproteobacteria bacterium]
MSIKRIENTPRMTKAVVHGDTVYLSGITADDRSATVEVQCQQILDKIDALLEKAGTNKSKLLSSQIWLTDISTWARFNTVWDAWVDPENAPARATVEAPLAAPGLSIEIMVIAAL